MANMPMIGNAGNGSVGQTASVRPTKQKIAIKLAIASKQAGMKPNKNLTGIAKNGSEVGQKRGRYKVPGRKI